MLLLQAGFLVCAKSARMPLFWSVHMLFDDLQSIQSGLSGFGSEIVQFQKALAEVEQGYSLFLLDEFARGTNPDEGAIIVQAVTRYLNDVNAISLLTTHYDKVAEHARPTIRSSACGTWTPSRSAGSWPPPTRTAWPLSPGT